MKNNKENIKNKDTETPKDLQNNHKHKEVTKDKAGTQDMENKHHKKTKNNKGKKIDYKHLGLLAVIFIVTYFVTYFAMGMFFDKKQTVRTKTEFRIVNFKDAQESSEDEQMIDNEMQNQDENTQEVTNPQGTQPEVRTDLSEIGIIQDDTSEYMVQDSNDSVDQGSDGEMVQDNEDYMDQDTDDNNEESTSDDTN